LPHAHACRLGRQRRRRLRRHCELYRAICVADVNRTHASTRQRSVTLSLPSHAVSQAVCRRAGAAGQAHSPGERLELCHAAWRVALP
jgi:hypothetical protein